MNPSISRRRKGIWIGLISLIMLSNYLLYALPIVPAAPKEVVLGSLLNFYVCNSNHHIFLYYKEKIFVNVYVSCSYSWIRVRKIYNS